MNKLKLHSNLQTMKVNAAMGNIFHDEYAKFSAYVTKHLQ